MAEICEDGQDAGRCVSNSRVALLLLIQYNNVRQNEHEDEHDHFFHFGHLKYVAVESMGHTLK
jgi:hypothetical protein